MEDRNDTVIASETCTLFAFISTREPCFGSQGQGSLAALLPSAPLDFAANSERPAGASEGLTVWCPLLQADPTTKVAGSFKIECPGAVCKMQRC